MAVYRVTVFYTQASTGWSETYWTPDASETVANARISTMLMNRAAMLWPIQFFAGARIAQEGAKRKSFLCLPGPNNWPSGSLLLDVPVRGVYVSPLLGSTRPDQVRSAAQLKVSFSDGYSTNRYLVGTPDLITGTEPDSFHGSQDPTWITRYQTWRDDLENGWQIRARTKPPTDKEYAAFALVREAVAPFRLGVVLPNVPPPAIDQEHKVQLRGFRRKAETPGASLNGQWYVGKIDESAVPGGVTIFLRGSDGLDPAQWKILGTAQRVVFTILAIQTIRIQKVGIHKRGRPSLAPVGRRKIRLRLDP